MIESITSNGSSAQWEVGLSAILQCFKLTQSAVLCWHAFVKELQTGSP